MSFEAERRLAYSRCSLGAGLCVALIALRKAAVMNYTGYNNPPREQGWQAPLMRLSFSPGVSQRHLMQHPRADRELWAPLVSGSQVDSVTPPGLEPQAFPSED